MSNLSGGYANSGGPPTRSGLPCFFCGRDVNIAPFGRWAGRPNKELPKTKKGERKRRPNPLTRSLISRVVCNICLKQGKE